MNKNLSENFKQSISFDTKEILFSRDVIVHVHLENIEKVLEVVNF